MVINVIGGTGSHPSNHHRESSPEPSLYWPFFFFFFYFLFGSIFNGSIDSSHCITKSFFFHYIALSLWPLCLLCFTTASWITVSALFALLDWPHLCLKPACLIYNGTALWFVFVCWLLINFLHLDLTLL